MNQEQYNLPKLSGDVLELVGVWTRAATGNVVKVERDERGVALASAGSWEYTLVAAGERGASAFRHIVSDGDRAIARDRHGVRQERSALVVSVSPVA